MIQDLENKKLYNEYEPAEPEDTDKVFCFDGPNLMVREDADGILKLPEAGDGGFDREGLQYLFRIDDEKYFLTAEQPTEAEGAEYKWESTRNLRQPELREMAFAAATAYHLYVWYRDNKFCGRCGGPLEHAEKERMLKCPKCGNMVYPKIAPAVIVAVTNGDKILLTKYNGRVYTKYALVAGFTEIGETAEATVKREVMEEVGLKVKNVTYYKSQPWGTDSNLLLGFFCELDGPDTITLDEDELSVAEWHERGKMPEKDDGFSLTRAMMNAFDKGEI